jgi:DNA relaxase NicK
MYDAVQAGNYKGFRKGNITAEIGWQCIREDGWTIYLGSRESERFTRYYNAKPVHGIEAF